ncbi:MAG: hypothetical protein ACPHIC_12240 [Acidimicrobiales bacterium]
MAIGSCLALAASIAEDIGDDAAACMAETLGFEVVNEFVRATFADDAEALGRANDSFDFAASFCGLS